MPSSKCQQISLLLGELYNDVRVQLSLQGSQKELLKFFSEAAKRLDAEVELAVKDSYDSGFDVGYSKGLREVSKSELIGSERGSNP